MGGYSGEDDADTVLIPPDDRSADEILSETDKVAVPDTKPPPGPAKPKGKRKKDLEDAPKRSRIGPYDVRRILGAGGMGVVYGARSKDGEEVAVKVLYDREGDGVRRFRREASIRIDSPHIVEVLSTGEDDDGLPYIVFELLKGEPISAAIEAGPVPPEVAVDIASQALEGLMAAHARGVVHRDIKPSNLFRTVDGIIKILDFGVAIIADQDGRITKSGGIVGTPMYLSPEQASGDPGIDESTDLWSLGVVLYELLTGMPPFQRETAISTLLAIVRDEPLPLRTVAPEVPEDLAAIVDRALEKDRRKRWRTAREVAEALRSVQISGRRPSRIVPPSDTTLTDEQSRVAVMLAEGVEDIDVIRAAVEVRRGALVPLVGHRALGLFGGERWEGDEIERAVAAAFEARLVSKCAAVASAQAQSGAGNVFAQALGLAEIGCRKGLGGVAIDVASIEGLDASRRVLRCDDEISEVLQEREPSTLLPLRMIPLLARGTELAEMRATFAKALDGAGAHPIVVVGPPGVGKTRLLQEMEKIVAERFVHAFVARLSPRHQVHAFSFMASLVSTVVDPDMSQAARRRIVEKMTKDAIGDDVRAREASEFIAELLGVELEASVAMRAARIDPRLMQDRLRAALIDLLVGIGRERPLVILVDDLHWADRESLDLLEEVEAELDRSLFFFATTRQALREPRGLFGGRARILEPPGLSAPDVQRLATALLGRSCPDDLASAIAARTGGQPLFVEHVVLGLPGPLPPALEAAVRSRIEQLPNPEKSLLLRAAVFGRPFVLEEIEHLVPGARPLLAALVRRGILHLRSRGDRSRRYRFASQTVEAIAHGMLPEDSRREVHRAAAAVVSAVDVSDHEDAGRHFELGGEPERAAEHQAKAAILALRRGDASSALRCSERAFENGVPAELHFATAVARSEALSSFGRRGEQVRLLEDAIRSAATSSDRAMARAELGWCLAQSRELDRALDILEEAVAEARRARDADTLARALGRSAVAMSYAGRIEDALVRLDQARGVPGVSAATEAQLAGFRAQVASEQEDPAFRGQAFQDAARCFEAIGDRRRAAAAATNLGDVWNRVGAYPDAAEALEHALADCRRVGHRPMEGYALLNLGYSLMMQNKGMRAIACFEDALAIAREVKDKRLELWCRIYRARSALGGVHPNASAEALEIVANEAQAALLPSVRVAALCVASRFLLQAKDVDGAVELSGRALMLRDEMGGVEEDEADVFAAHVAALEAQGKKVEARAVRKRGREQVEEIARRIQDDRWRARFLMGVPAHEALGVDQDITALGTRERTDR